MKIKMLKTKTLNKTITTTLILLLTIAMLSVINLNIIPQSVEAVDIPSAPSQGIMVNTTGFWRAGKNFQSSGTPIQAAINNASGTDLNITVAAGTYSEDVAVTKSVTLAGNLTDPSLVTVISTYAVSAFTVTANNVNISGFTMTGTGIDPSVNLPLAGVYLDSVDGCNISDNVMVGESHGVYLDVGSDNNTITRNNASDNNQGFTVEPYGTTGVSADNNFTDNIANSNWKYGFFVESGENTTFTGNTANLNTRNGFRFVHGNDNTLIYNNIVDNTLEGVRQIGTAPTVPLNATLNWWGNSTGPGYNGGVGGLGTGDYISDNVHYVPWLNAAYPGGVSTTPFSIIPTATKGSVQKWFNVTVQNIGSPAAVDYVNITYPSSFTLHTYNYQTGWTQSHDISGKTVTFAATGGYQLDISESGRFDFEMTTSSSSDDYKILCKNLMGGMGYQNLTISVDSTAPTVTLSTLPTYYSLQDVNRMYINGTILDDTYSTPSLAINDTTHFPTNPQVLTYNATATSYTWYFRFYNTSAVADGSLAVNVTGTDAAGNVESGGNVVSTTVDNTAPTLITLVVMDDKIGNLTSVGNTFYMSGTATGLNITIGFSEAHPYSNVTYIYNGTGTTTKTFQNNTWFYSGAQNWYNVTGINTVTIYNITITDAALPNNNTLVTSTYTITRDQAGPTVPTYTVTEICGGLIIKNLNATDNVGVLRYEVYMNGTSFLNVTATQLANTTLDWVTGALNASCVFDGTLVLNLTNYAGGHANLTIRATDLGGNSGNFSTPAVYTITEGRWYQIELQVNWNLISLPLIPASTARADVLSLILKQGATGVRFIYGYNNNTDAWVLNPSTMEDGFGYWINMEAYDVLIVSGRISSAPPALPPNYYLTAGWVLAGYKSINTRTVANYLSSLPNATYFKYIYAWDATTQSWNMLDRENAAHTLSPGTGSWIWMYSDQTLIPPIP